MVQTRIEAASLSSCVVMCINTLKLYGILHRHKKNDIMPFAETWMKKGTLILSEISQKGKDKYHMISLITGI